MAGCVGVPYRDGGEDAAARYNRKFAGLSRDAVIVHFGAPNRTVRLDSGVRIMEYKSSINRGARIKESCVLRFWYRTDTIIYVDYRGERAPCDNLVDFGENSAYY